MNVDEILVLIREYGDECARAERWHGSALAGTESDEAELYERIETLLHRRFDAYDKYMARKRRASVGRVGRTGAVRYDGDTDE